MKFLKEKADLDNKKIKGFYKNLKESFSDGPTDLILELDDLIHNDNFNKIVVDGSIFDDFQKDAIINISFSDATQDIPYSYIMKSQDPDTLDITMEIVGRENKRIKEGYGDSEYEEDFDLERNLSIELYSDGVIYISERGDSGSKYMGSTNEDIVEAVRKYLENN